MEYAIAAIGAVALLSVMGWAARNDESGQRQMRNALRQVAVCLAVAGGALLFVWVFTYGNY